MNSENLSFIEDIYLKDMKVVLAKSKEDQEHSKTWTTIYQHSMAKLSKSYAERCFAPNPLPEEVSQKLNTQIELSRDLLLEMLFRQGSQQDPIRDIA